MAGVFTPNYRIVELSSIEHDICCATGEVSVPLIKTLQEIII